MSAIGLPLVLLVYLVPVVVVGFVVYAAVRFGVSHGMRDARRAAGSQRPNSPDAGPSAP